MLVNTPNSPVTKIILKNVAIDLVESKIVRTFAVAFQKMVAWMSGLVTGLQNQVQRFESACDLKTLGADSIGVSVF